MAAAGGQSPVNVIERLFVEPQRFEFFAAVQRLERRAQAAADGRPVNWNASPRRQPVRFSAQQSQTYPACDVVSVAPGGRSEAGDEPPEMTVAFLGLTGPHGVLPRHYSQLVLNEMRDARRREAASARGRAPLQDLLDLFNHRQTVLFYRAWQKYRLHALPPPSPAARERHDPPQAAVLFSLIGLNTGDPESRLQPQALRNRLSFPDEVLLYFAGLFAHWPRNALALEQAAAKLFGVPLQIRQFQPQWIALRPQDQSRLPRGHERPVNVSLGQSVIVGSRVPSHDTRFRVRLGPLSWRDFCRFSPDGDALAIMAQFVRLYVGPELDFDIQPILQAAENPGTRLGAAGETPSRLGWNTWMWNRWPSRDAEDAVFVVSGIPDR